MNDSRVKTCPVCDEIYAVAHGHTCRPVEPLLEMTARIGLAEDSAPMPPPALSPFQREQVRRIVREEIEAHTRRVIQGRSKVVP